MSLVQYMVVWYVFSLQPLLIYTIESLAAVCANVVVLVRHIIAHKIKFLISLLIIRYA